jgi:hypothetical protein
MNSGEILNPYFDIWKEFNQMYVNPGPMTSMRSGPPVTTTSGLNYLVGLFAWSVPSCGALHLIKAYANSVIDMGSGGGYWSLMLRQIGVQVTAVDPLPEPLLYSWIDDTKKQDGFDYLSAVSGNKETPALLLNYPYGHNSDVYKWINEYKGTTIFYVGSVSRTLFTGGNIDMLLSDWIQEECDTEYCKSSQGRSKDRLLG